MLAAAAPAVHADGADTDLPSPEPSDFVELFRMHYGRVVRALSLAGAMPATAEDLAQEAFARTFGHWRRVRRGPNAPGYVYRVAFRLLRRRGLIPTTAVDEAVNGPEEGAVLAIDLERALAAMPPRRRACVVLCACLEVSTAEAAEILRVAPGTVRKQLELARATLRRDLGVPLT
jgi:RNA polymerase sigma factor (sigma-70 family)